MRRKSGAFVAALALSCLLPQIARAEKWGKTTAEELGITQEEFRKVKEIGMSRTRLNHLLEIGIRPNEYFGEPWKKLGVSESYWLTQRKAGLEDDDINRSFRRRQSGELSPFLAFVLPGYYHYQTRRPYAGALLSAMAAGGVATLVLAPDVPPALPIAVLASAMVWSAGDAIFHTRYSDNQDARRFSFHLSPTVRGGQAQVIVFF